MSLSVARLDFVTAITLPSGDHESGNSQLSSVANSSGGTLPSLGITNKLNLPFRFDAKAICFPSGDQMPERFVACVVNRVHMSRSMSYSQRSDGEPEPMVTSTWCPSEDNRGSSKGRFT